MGILEVVSDEHAGIIPRSIAQIFNHVHANAEIDCTISMSFLQIYRETIQDLLGPITGSSNMNMEDNLAVREDPQRGFYVEGLQEFAVNNYAEAGNEYASFKVAKLLTESAK
jgi:kinesin family member 5